MTQKKGSASAARRSDVYRAGAQARPKTNAAAAQRTVRKSSAPAKNGKKTPPEHDRAAIVLGLLIAALAVVLIVHLTANATVKQVTVKYTQEAAKAASEKRITDDEFIRQAGIVSRKMSDIDLWREEAADNIARMPGFLLDSIKKTSNSSVQLVIGARIPVAVLSTGSGYITIDKDKYIIDKKASYSDGESILVDGISLRNPTVGQPAVDVSTDDRLENALYVINILRDNRLTPYFTNIHMLAENEVRLVSAYDISVIINMWFRETFAEDLTATVQVLNEKGAKRQTGWIYAVNGNITWHEDADYFSPIKGK